jgi:hypothetical protein
MSRIDIHDRAFRLDRYERQGAPDMGDSVLGMKERESAHRLVTADIGQPTEPRNRHPDRRRCPS